VFFSDDVATGNRPGQSRLGRSSFHLQLSYGAGWPTGLATGLEQIRQDQDPARLADVEPSVMSAEIVGRELLRVEP
jgi:hypothetical protein